VRLDELGDELRIAVVEGVRARDTDEVELSQHG
jgi:hypothetical protein